MSKISIYKEGIIKLRKEGKKYKEISDILGCSFSTISYFSSSKERQRCALVAKKGRQDGSLYLHRSKIKYRNRLIVDEYLKNHPCVDCGNSDIRVLEFDHVKGEKIGNICHAIHRAWNVEKLMKEIEKCEVRCANCHRIITKERLKIKTNNN